MGQSEHIGDPDFEDDDFDGDDFDDQADRDPPIDETERRALNQDLSDVRVLSGVLGNRGVKGVVVWCPDCEDDHYLSWELLAGNLQQILESGKTPVHEPAWEPDPDEYVSWDYARGFLDGFESDHEINPATASCGWCGHKLPDEGRGCAFCPRCGHDLAPMKLVVELESRGWDRRQIHELLRQSGFDPPLFED